MLRAGLKDIEKELGYHKKKCADSQTGGDKFVSVMKDFITIANYNFSDLEDTRKEMKQKVSVE